MLQVVETLFLKEYTGEQCLLKLLKILTGMTYYEFFRAKPGELAEYIYLCTFLLSEKTGLIPQLIPVHDDFYGPDKGYNNLLMEELVFTEDFFMKWHEEKEDVKLMDGLISVLYRPAKIGYDFVINKDGDARIPFNQYECEWNAKNVISKWPLKMKLAIATIYGSYRNWLVDANPEVFGGVGGDPAMYGLISIIRMVAKNGAFGDFKKVEKLEVNLVMIELNESVADGKAMEKAVKA